MKPLQFSAAAAKPLFFKQGSEANLITEKFKVLGNCGKCKNHIENALKEEGVGHAVWDQATKMATVKFNPEVITIDELHQKCADAGYDTEKLKAGD